MRNTARLIALVLAFALAALSSAPAAAQGGPAPYTTGYRYDGMGRLTGTVSPDPDGAGPLAYRAVRNSYDGAGRLIRVEEGELAAWPALGVAPSAWTGFTVFRTVDTGWDPLDRKTSERVSGAGATASLTQHSYDLDGRLVCTAVRMNPALFADTPADACVPGPPGSGAEAFGPDRVTRNTYDAAGQLLKVEKAVGTSLRQDYAAYTYNGNGLRTSLTDARGFKAEMRYDGHDRQRLWLFPSKSQPGLSDPSDYEQYGWDRAGNRIALRKRDGSELSYAYDALNRMIVKTVPERSGLDPAHSRDVFYAWDLRGLQTRARFDGLEGDGVTQVYDGFGRLVSSRIAMPGFDRSLAYAYDADGNRTELTYPGGQKAWFGHDGMDRMNALGLGPSGGGSALAAIAYDRAGRREALARAPGEATSYAYDGAGRIASIADTFAGGTGGNIATYAYNPASQIVTRTRSNDNYAYRNLADTSRSYAANGLDQYTEVGGAALGYDPNGNLILDPGAATGAAAATTFTYDIENRLVGASGGRTATLRYDPLGRLYETNGLNGYTYYLYDGDALVEEYGGSQQLLRRYIHGPGVDEPLVWFEAPSLASPRFFHADHQGSITAIGDAAGALTGIHTYDSWGDPRPHNPGRFQFTGQILIGELGLYHYKARFYSPTLGRFLQTDPVGYDDQVNLYAYVGNDPVNSIDPTGRFKNCTPNDPTCIETPESAQLPDPPPPPSPDEEEMEDIIVTGKRPQKIDYTDDNEEFFVVMGGTMSPRELVFQDVTCPSGASVRVGSTSPLPAGGMGAHSHGGGLEQHPGPRDDDAARRSTKGVAGVMTQNRSFTIRRFGNGTFRTRQVEGPSLSDDERSELTRNMQNWEQNVPQKGQSLQSRVCK